MASEALLQTVGSLEAHNVLAGKEPLIEVPAAAPDYSKLQEGYTAYQVSSWAEKRTCVKTGARRSRAAAAAARARLAPAWAWGVAAGRGLMVERKQETRQNAAVAEVPEQSPPSYRPATLHPIAT